MYKQTEDDLKFQITLPSVHLITGIWWQADYRDKRNAYIVRVNIRRYFLVFVPSAIDLKNVRYNVYIIYHRKKNISI